VDTLGEESTSNSNVKIGLLNLRVTGRTLETMSGLGGQKRRLPTMKLSKLYTIWSCATEGEACEALLGMWVKALVQFRQF
jgi:hypothetical protein